MHQHDLEQLVSYLPTDLKDCIDIEEAKLLEGKDEEVFRENLEFLVCCNKKDNKSALLNFQYGPLPDATVGFGALAGFYVPVHEGLHAVITAACGGKVQGIVVNNVGVAVISSGNAACQLASAIAPYALLTPVGIYFVKEGIKEKNSVKIMFGAGSLAGTADEIFPYEFMNIQSDLYQAAIIISDKLPIPETAIKAGLIAGILGFSYGVVKAAEYAKDKAKQIKLHK